VLSACDPIRAIRIDNCPQTAGLDITSR
jgi:hypothetical protein